MSLQSSQMELPTLEHLIPSIHLIPFFTSFGPRVQLTNLTGHPTCIQLRQHLHFHIRDNATCLMSTQTSPGQGNYAYEQLYRAEGSVPSLNLFGTGIMCLVRQQ